MRQFYTINSAVAANQSFLRETALQGYGYLADGRLVIPQITPGVAPNPLPQGVNRNWRFLNANIVVAPAGAVPLGNRGNALVDGSSAAIVRNGVRGVVMPNLATFRVQGRPEIRTADDRVTADAGIYHIDLYRIAPRAEIQGGTINAAQVTLESQP
ncbi:MAG: hypothetical protein HC774_00180 [Sphingomonadales bacterium]|nr:hypothetical protein [Sphingomonadales bacterium]